MDTIGIGITAFKYLISILPQPKSPATDYSELRGIYKEHYEKLGSLYGLPGQATDVQPVEMGPAPAPAPKVTTYHARPIQATPEKITASGAPVSTSCIACSSSHVATVAGALGEAMRFARENGIMHPEVIKRLDAADQEITIMERIDLSAEAVRNSPANDQELAKYFLPKIRELRQNLGNVASVDDLEKTAADASVLSHEFRLKRMEQNGVDLNPIVALAKKVQAGEISIEDARAQVKQYLPKGA